MGSIGVRSSLKSTATIDFPHGAGYTGVYRFSFNGKENDNEVKGDGNQQDYGMRVYDTRLGKFLSADPLAKDYPELTTYQFASNTPIRAIDLDGLEAVVINYGYRVTAMIITGSFNTGAVVDIQGNVKIFTQWSVGPAIGAYAGGGLGVSFYPTANAEQIMGHGVNFGGNIGVPGISIGLDINGSIQMTDNIINGVKLGVSPALRPLSLGPGGVEVHLDYSFSEDVPEMSFNIKNVTKETKNNLQNLLQMSSDEVEKYLNILKASSIKLQGLNNGSERESQKTNNNVKKAMATNSNNFKKKPTIDKKTKDSKEKEKIEHNKG